jgi:hypothetical protein
MKTKIKASIKQINTTNMLEIMERRLAGWKGVCYPKGVGSL